MQNFGSHLNPNSHLTAKERTNLSFPARILLNEKRLTGEVLDFGCGFGSDVKLLREKGISVEGYDPHYFPDYPQKRFDTILCFYVLNVLLPEEQAAVLIELSRLVKPTGRVYIAVRRDLRYEGFRTHRLYQQKTYQCNVVLKSKTIFRNQNCEIYEYRHFNQLSHPEHPDCPFCKPEQERELIAESATVYAMHDKFPVSEGHALIIPKRHTSDYFDLSFREQSACLFMLNKVKEIVTDRYRPDGFNMGINIGEKAGQTIPHAHLHLIPRYDGDVEEPRGGIRGVVPSKRSY